MDPGSSACAFAAGLLTSEGGTSEEAAETFSAGMVFSEGDTAALPERSSCLAAPAWLPGWTGESAAGKSRKGYPAVLSWKPGKRLRKEITGGIAIDSFL